MAPHEHHEHHDHHHDTRHGHHGPFGDRAAGPDGRRARRSGRRPPWADGGWGDAPTTEATDARPGPGRGRRGPGGRPGRGPLGDAVASLLLAARAAGRSGVPGAVEVIEEATRSLHGLLAATPAPAGTAVPDAGDGTAGPQTQATTA